MISRVIEGMKGSLVNQDRFFLFFSLSSLLLHGFLLCLFFVNIPLFRTSGQEFIPLHYKIFVGIDYLAPWYALFALPLTALAILIINVFASKAVFRVSTVAAAALIITAFVSQALLLLALFLIIQINLF